MCYIQILNHDRKLYFKWNEFTEIFLFFPPGSQGMIVRSLEHVYLHRMIVRPLEHVYLDVTIIKVIVL